MQEREEAEELVTPGEVLGKGSQLKAGRGAYFLPQNGTVYASLTGRRSLIPPSPLSSDQVYSLFFSFSFLGFFFFSCLLCSRMLEMPQFYLLSSFVFSLLIMLLFWLGTVLHSVWMLRKCWQETERNF